MADDPFGPFAGQDAELNAVPVEQQIAKSLEFIHGHGQRVSSTFKNETPLISTDTSFFPYSSMK